MNYKLLCLILVLHATNGLFIGFSDAGNYWVSEPLVLQWSHNFTGIRGCVWSYMGESHNTDFTFISYGTKEGLEIKILGWELLDNSRPCAGGIMKKNSSQSDAGLYEMRVVAGSFVRSGRYPVGITSPKLRSVIIRTGSNVIELIPGQDDMRIVYLGSDGRFTVILHDKYPDDTCTSVHRIGRNQTEVICNRTIEFNLEADVMYVQISVKLDIVNTKPFVFYVAREGLAERNQDKRSSISVGIICLASLLLITLLIVGAMLYSKTRREIRSICNCEIERQKSSDIPNEYVRKEINIPDIQEDYYGSRDLGSKVQDELECDSDHESVSEMILMADSVSEDKDWGLPRQREGGWISDSELEEVPRREITKLQQRFMQLERRMKLELVLERSKREAAEEENHKVFEALGSIVQQTPLSKIHSSHGQERKYGFQPDSRFRKSNQIPTHVRPHTIVKEEHVHTIKPLCKTEGIPASSRNYLHTNMEQNHRGQEIFSAVTAGGRETR